MPEKTFLTLALTKRLEKIYGRFQNDANTETCSNGHTFDSLTAVNFKVQVCMREKESLGFSMFPAKTGKVLLNIGLLAFKYWESKREWLERRRATIEVRMEPSYHRERARTE